MMGMTLECTFEEFKKACGEFFHALPTMNRDELEGAWNALALMYLGMNEENWRRSAEIALQIAGDAKIRCEMELDRCQE